jgi:hypothetical protein
VGKHIAAAKLGRSGCNAHVRLSLSEQSGSLYVSGIVQMLRDANTVLSILSGCLRRPASTTV